jgi:methylmalonyl-CoA mutase cobalamin-binding subunit
MAGQHDTDKHQISVKFHHRVWRQIEIAAEQTNPRMTPGEYIRFVVGRNVDSIPLSAADAQIIADRIALAEHKGKMV